MTHFAIEPQRTITAARARQAAKAWVDSYRPAEAMHPAICRQCRAAHFRGRWRWDAAPPDLPPVLCPACERMRDGVAAHVVELCGDLPPHWGEVKSIVAQVERTEYAERPLERVMKIESDDESLFVSTTGLHVARRLVAALARRFRRGVRLSFGEGWTRLDWLEPRELGV